MEPNRVMLSDSEYLDMEEELLSTPKGRAFLREHANRNRVIALDKAREILHEMPRVAVPNSDTRLEVVRVELQDMAASIAEARRQINALQPQDTGNNRILAATEELDAIVFATERATSDILNAAERIQTYTGKIREASLVDVANDIENLTTEILIACSFQDITGQRTTKVVNVLRYIEQRVNAMVAIWGTEQIHGAGDPLPMTGPSDKRPDAHLLHGPQLPGQGHAQDDIDRLMGGFNVPVLSAETGSAPADIGAGSHVEVKTAKTGDAPLATAAQPVPLDQGAIDSLFD